MLDKIISSLNQRLHNLGVAKQARLDVILNYIKTNKSTFDDIETLQLLIKLKDKINESENDILQTLFMSFGKIVLKKDFNQFYTPYYLAELFGMMSNNQVKVVLEPTCGTGDLVSHINAKKYVLRDIDTNIEEYLKLNLKVNGIDLKKCDIQIKDSLAIIENTKADVCVMNPPFGVKTKITDKKILDLYDFSCNKDGQQIGLLFIEKALKELKLGGLLYAILPRGYVSNNSETNIRKKIMENYKMVAILMLPKNTFKRSGTGVETCILVIQNETPKPDDDYEIFIEKIEKIGYDLTKGETPKLFKKDNETGDFLLNDGKKILDNDLYDIAKKMKYFAFKNKIKFMQKSKCVTEYKSIKKTNITKSDKYDMSILKYWMTNNDNKQTINSLCSLDTDITKLTKNEKKELKTDYLYLPIKEIQTGLYGIKNILKPWKLPNRASFIVKEDDILISRLVGKTSFCIIGKNCENIIATNAVAVIRLSNISDRMLVFYNLINGYINKQINMLGSGSIMSSIKETELLNNIYLNKYAEDDEVKIKSLMENYKAISSTLHQM